MTTAAREPMLSNEDLAAELAVPMSTVQRWRKHRTGPVGVRVGKHVRYRRADVDAWLDAHRDRQAAS